ncbi:MAG: hypothetical protein Q8M58_11490 [Anaerolineales bacterium]|nr:hypothetical protein [Anaerolineales bacterium]
MCKVFTFFARFIAAIFAILFVITAVLALLLFNVERQLFNPNLYKRALTEEQIYKHLPGIIGELLTTSMSYNPCAQNPLVCEDISAELRACYMQRLGEERYTALASGQDQPTEAEKEAIQPCLDRYGTQSPPEEYTLATASQEVQSCVYNKIGYQNYQQYNELLEGAREPTEEERKFIVSCFEQNGASLEPEESGGPPSYMRNLTARDWETIIAILLPPTELKALAENTLDQIFAYLDGKTDNVKIPLLKLKERITGPAGQDAIQQLIIAQPPCTEEQLVQMAAGALGGEGGMVFCNPPEEILAIMLPELQSQLGSLATKIPDEAVIIKPYTGPLGATPGGGPLSADPFTTIRYVRLGLRWSPLLPFAFLLLVILFSVRSLKSWLRWWGISIFFAGGIALVLGIALLPAMNWAWNAFVITKIPPFLSADIGRIGHGLASFILQGLSKQIIIQTTIFIILGLAAWVGSYFIRDRRKESNPVTPPTAPTA